MIVNSVFSGIHSHLMALVGLMESCITNVEDIIKTKQSMAVFDLLEKTVGKWHRLVEEAVQKVSALQTGSKKDANKDDLL